MDNIALAAPARVGLPFRGRLGNGGRGCRPRPRGVAAIRRQETGVATLPPPPAWGCPLPGDMEYRRIANYPAKSTEHKKVLPFLSWYSMLG